MKKKLVFAVFTFLFLLTITVITASAHEVSNKSKNISVECELSTRDHVHESNLPLFLEIIEEEAFEGTSIVRIDIPNNVTTIGDYAFANIDTLQFIKIPTITTTIASTAFAGSNDVTINAAPNSYAREYARALRIPFTPIASFCATNSSSVLVRVIENKNEVLEHTESDDQVLVQQWQRVDEIKVVGTLDIIFNEIQGRGPPMREVNC